MNTSSRDRSTAVLVAVVVVGAFHLLWWNRFLGVTTDGWFLVYAEKMLAGEVPYRDFYMYAPPLHALKLAALISVFGEKLIVIKAWGLLERLAITGLLCHWIGRFTPPWAASLATLTTMIVFSCDIAETLSFYNHDSAYWFVLSAFLTSKILDRLQGPSATRLELLLAFAAGASASASFLSKQTVGLAAPVCLGTLLALFATRVGPWRRIRGALGCWAVGLAAPVAIVWGWLASLGALTDSIDQTLVAGTAAKGSMASTLFRPITSVFAIDTLLAPAAWATIPVLLLVVRRPLGRRLQGLDRSRASLGALAGAALALILFSRAWQQLGPRTPLLVAVYVAFFGSALAALEPGIRWLRRSESPSDRQWLILCGTGFTIAFAFSISWPAFELMAAPGLAVVVAWSFGNGENDLIHRWARTATVVACAIWITAAVQFKLQTPFGWGLWTEPPVALATEKSESPLLSGLRLSGITRDAVDEVVARIGRHSSPDEAIFVFPHMPIFYALAHRRPATFAITHWFDVAPDELCVADARRILENPPAVLVMQELSPAVFESHEASFRDGRPSGQRELLAAIGELARSSSYTELEPIRARSARLRTWVRTGD